MADITELERRITNAFDRMMQGVDALASAMPSEQERADATELEALRATLQATLEEKAALQDQVTTRAAPDDLATKVKAQSNALADLEAEVSRLRLAMEALRTNNDALRTANATGVGDAHLINTALMAQLESLRAERAIETQQFEALLSGIEAALAVTDATTAPDNEDEA